MRAKLNTLHMFEGMDPSDTDYSLWREIAQYMDGEAAIVAESQALPGQYVFLGLLDAEKNKELHYMMEQDRMFGVYGDDREEFNRDWDSGEYEPGGSFYLEAEYVILDTGSSNVKG